MDKSKNVNVYWVKKELGLVRVMASPQQRSFYPPTPYAADPMKLLIIYPLNLKEYMISMGSAA